MSTALFDRYEWFRLDTNAPGCAGLTDRILLLVTGEDETHIQGEAVSAAGVPLRPHRVHRIDKRVIVDRGHYRTVTR